MRRFMAAVAVTACCFAAAAQDTIKGEVGAELDRVVQRISLGQFWGAVLVAKDGEVLLAKGYGAANESLTPVSSRSLFDIGSISKCFTAAAILKLEEEGKLSIEDSITRFYPESPADKKDVTIKSLLTHTSGISADAPNAYDKGDVRDDVVTGFLNARRLSEPGAKYQYSNAGYFILAAVVEKASGERWQDYMAGHVLKPAGMASSGCCGDERLDRGLMTARQDARGRIDGDAATWPYPYEWGYKGAGGVVSSVADMYAWDQALRTDSVLSAESRKKSLTPALNSYALGWEVRDTASGRTAFHSGGVRGFTCAMTRWVDDNACVIVLTNERGNPVALSKALSEQLFPEMAERAGMVADLNGAEIGEHGMVKVAESVVVVKGGTKKGEVEIEVKRPATDNPFLRLTMSAGAARAFLLKLDAAIETVKKAGAGTDKGAVVELYTAAYGKGAEKVIERDGEGVGLEAMGGTMHPEPGGTKRVLVYVRDETRSFLPMFMKLERGSAEELAAGIRKTIGN